MHTLSKTLIAAIVGLSVSGCIDEAVSTQSHEGTATKLTAADAKAFLEKAQNDIYILLCS